MCGQLDQADTDPLAVAALSSGFTSAVAVPLEVGEVTIGVLTFHHVEPIEPCEERDHVLEHAGWITAQAVTRLEVKDYDARNAKLQGSVNAIQQRVGETATVTDALRVALDGLRSEFGWRYAGLWTVDRDRLRLTAQDGQTPDALAAAPLPSPGR